MIRRIALIALALAAVLGTPVPGAQALTVGLAEQRATAFSDPLLSGLGIRRARLAVAWDAMRHRWQRGEIDEWMAATRAAGIAPLVTFGRSRTERFRLPAPAEYALAVRRFHRRYPRVHEYSPWNEPNLARAPRHGDPRRIAAYHRALRAMCPACRVLGADVVDSSSLERWMRAYLDEFAPGERPRLWGLHNYVDVNSASSWGTRTMLRLAPGRIWFTETGAIVRRATPSVSARGDRRALIRTGHRRARAASRRIFALARLSPRIGRVYVYHWRATTHDAWDSALLSPGGRPRPSFRVFAREARRQGAR
jgi:hypothetical protein